MVLGIDGGLSGALSVLEVAPDFRFTLVDVFDMPFKGDGGSKRIDGPVLFKWLDQHDIQRAHFERVQAKRGNEGATSMLKFARAVGTVEGIIECCGIEICPVEAASWKKWHKLGADKFEALQLARRLFPKVDYFNRVMDHNRAESALIGIYGEAKLRGKP